MVHASERSRSSGKTTSRLRREQYRKKLDGLLKAADEGPFLGLIWATQTLQSGGEDAVRGALAYSTDAAKARLGDELYLPAWDLETVANERLALPQFRPPPPGESRRQLDTGSFRALEQIVRLSRAIENADMGLVLQRMDVLQELRRIAHRQFSWQRGYLNGPQFYRWAFLYSGPQTQDLFEERAGITISEFIRFGMYLRAVFSRWPVWTPGRELETHGFSQAQAQAALMLLAAPIETAMARATACRGRSWSSTYRPSQLRGAPLIGFPEARFRAPLPDLIAVRITEGLYYDLAGGPGGVRNEVAERFERYVRDLLAASLPGLAVSEGPRYRWRKNDVAGPDVLLCDGERVVAAFECKARKMSFEARFGEDPAKGEAGLGELGEGVFQLWKFASHVRRGLIKECVLDAKAVLVLLTLDNWMTFSTDFQKGALERARLLSSERDPGITEEDQGPVVFASIEDVELTLQETDERLFVERLQAGTEERFRGWVLPNINQDAGTGIENPYPLGGRIAEVLPWIGDYLKDDDPE
jgi:hypothetical protein